MTSFLRALKALFHSNSSLKHHYVSERIDKIPPCCPEHDIAMEQAITIQMADGKRVWDGRTWLCPLCAYWTLPLEKAELVRVKMGLKEGKQ